MVYPDNFRETSIRSVSPEESLSDAQNHSPASDAEFLASATASPRGTLRAKPRDRRREFSPFHAGHKPNDEELPVPDSRSLRARSKTTTMEDQRGDLPPSSFLGRTRMRLGSLTTAATANVAASASPQSPRPPLHEDSISSIGFPSIIQTPGQRPRFVKSQSTLSPGLPSSNASSPGPYVSHHVLNPDSSKILDLMKSTCGRMHGILSFRISGAAAWTSGYCAINVAAGSLIYQAKGEPSLAKTLIPDLRGCRVRTLYSAETQSSYLSVSTHSSTLSVHLRPHVKETCDSWLAALLCWQPIRPKGVQNKMTKPQSVAITERRLADRRRNSESTLQKEATIIKVGKMLLWDRQSASGVCPPPTPRRISTFKQQRALSQYWRKVNCTLQENGHMKIVTEAGTNLVSFIQLSQLSRCAIQKLDASVLQDEFCIAIYPQYAVHAGSDHLTRPIYLSMESRVLFEVWFVLLRAFTIPELYGPEQPPSTDELSRSHPLAMSQALPATTTDMFRIERLLNVRVIEAKIFSHARAEQSEKSKKSSKQQGHAQTAGDYYAEVLLDGEVRGKTAVRNSTSAPFWREDFTFHDLPPVLSSATVLVKTLNPSQKDWTLISRGTYTPTEGEREHDPLTGIGDVEIASQDTTFGRIDLPLDSLDPGNGSEKWWHILDDNDQPVGEMLMRVQLDETVVLMSQEYKVMSELLHSFPNGLTVHLAELAPQELRQLSEIFLDIFQVSGQASEWVTALVEDEIDGLHRETSASRLRYTSRIHSNDSYESGQEREVLVRDLGRSATVEANLLFRGNSLLTKSLDMHMRRLGKEYLEETIGSSIRDIDESDPDCEIDPNRVSRQEDLERNWRNLIILTSNMWQSIAGSASRCPPELRYIFRHIRACAEDRYGDFLRSVTYSSVSGFLFLRFFCPAILNPKLFGLLKEHPRARAQRTLTLVAKGLQGLANLTTFGNKEPFMEPMNKFLMSHRNEFKDFIDSICAIPAERPPQIVNPSFATPIQILGRLPPTSREGFPSLPFLIDNARSFACLARVWLQAAPSGLTEIPDMDVNILKFHSLCIELENRTKESLNKAEQAEQPSGNLEVKWEELVEQIEKSGTFYEESSSKANTPSKESTITSVSSTTAGNNRNSIGYFPRTPYLKSTEASISDDADDDTPSSATSAPWEQNRPTFTQPKYYADSRKSTESLHNSSTVSLTQSETPKNRQSGMSRDSGKYRLFEFVDRTRRKGKERESAQPPPDVGPRNEFI
ncbi:GTPase activating protein [Arthroderma uncinatum]|uniref:GTPase activating protein n=1 Tax=Arthroderma uncinatum TaxID=74035 RepID=UPI00144A8037|nr:GTPase activating protein [Arthroderma uncinatum]KAF3490507.1 GTPase activating protein [Arthroderma uncinatum]